MTGGKKVTVKSLGEELELLKEQVREMSTLKQKVNDLEKIIENMKLDRNTNKNVLKCRKCDTLWF